MGLFDTIFRRLKQQPKLIEESKIKRVTNDTTPLILIETLEYILRDNKAYRRFKNGNDKYFFENGVTMQDYKMAFSEYVEFLLRRGVHFSKKELNRIKKITGKKYKLQESSNKVATSVGEIIRNPELLQQMKLEEYKDGSLTIFKDIGTNDIKQELINSIQGLTSETNNVYSHRLANYVSTIADEKRGDGSWSFSEANREKINSEIQINPQFKQLVLSKIPKGIQNKEELAYVIYNAVNQCIVYDSTYFALAKDKKNPNVKKLFDMQIPEITPDNNKVICVLWAQVYSYFLKLYGIDSSIKFNVTKFSKTYGNGERIERLNSSHKYVEVYVDDQIIEADATNATRSKIDNTSMSDLTRTKIGIVPAGFRSEHFEEIAKKHSMETISDRVDKIKTLIKSNGINNERSDTIEGFEQKIRIISEQLKQSNLDNMANMQYLRTLHWIFLSSKSKINWSLYMQDEKGKCYIKPIIAMDMGNEQQHKYRYFIVDDSKRGIEHIGKEELERAIREGILHQTVEKKKHLIPGIDYDSILPQMPNNTRIIVDRGGI